MKQLRIVHIAEFGLSGQGRTYLGGVAAKLSNGWIRAGHSVMDFSDRDIARWNGYGHKRWGKRATNRILLDFCRSNQPDVVALGHADTIDSETLERIRAVVPAVKILHWHVDWIAPREMALPNDPTSANIRNRIRSRLDFVDAAFVTTAGENLAQLAGGKALVGFMPNPVDLSIERGRNFERNELPYDVFFASGSDDDRRYHCGGWQSMAELARDLEVKLPSSSLCLLGLNGRPKLFGPSYENAVLSSRIGLNISRRNDIFLYSSDRIAQLVGNGLAVCIDRATGYGTLFGEDALVFYSSTSELTEALARLKRDDPMRRAIAERGWRRYFELFDSRIIGEYMIDATFGRHDPSRYSWPTVVDPAARSTAPQA